MDENEDAARVQNGVMPHELVDFIHFGVDGLEVERRGHVWGAAPPVKGMKCFWVLPIAPDGGDAPAEGRASLAVAVVLASRRHRVGWERRTGSGTAWAPRRGRYVDKGTYYAETHSLSPTGALTAGQRGPAQPPSRIEVPPLDPSIFRALSGESDPVLLQ